MQISIYRSHTDLFQGENLQSDVTWFRDKDDE